VQGLHLVIQTPGRGRGLRSGNAGRAATTSAPARAARLDTRLMFEDMYLKFAEFAEFAEWQSRAG
jgi:hypothetical protein